MSIADISPAVLVMVGVLIVVQLVLEVWAIVDIIRRPATSIAGGSKLVWILVVILVNFLGALAYFAFGRRDAADAAVGASPRADATTHASDAVDLLYGPRDGVER